MKLSKTNPCEYEWLVELVKWGETDCWCCSTVRGIVVGLAIGLPVGIAATGKVGTALLVACFTCVIAIAMLRAARAWWTDGEGDGR